VFVRKSRPPGRHTRRDGKVNKVWCGSVPKSRRWSIRSFITQNGVFSRRSLWKFWDKFIKASSLLREEWGMSVLASDTGQLWFVDRNAMLFLCLPTFPMTPLTRSREKTPAMITIIINIIIISIIIIEAVPGIFLVISNRDFRGKTAPWRTPGAHKKMRE